jgi:hypothetical protein
MHILRPTISFLVRAQLLLTLFISLITLGYGQSRPPKPDEIPPQFRPPHPPAKVVERYFTIDQKRRNEEMYTDEAMPRSREFKRIDSTYYVGWMFEGVYKYTHAADYLGFKNASVPLQKALNLLERDYKKALSTRTSDVMVYYPIYKLHIDYTMLAYYLMNCYSNTDQVEKTYALLRRVAKFNLQRQYYMDAYDYLAWTVHRNRFYTKAKYSFLGNSIDENEQLAQRYLDTAMRVIERNKVLHDKLEPDRLDDEKNSVYHYRNILYSYALNVDSALHYFDLMKQAGRLPHNNYATFNTVIGRFETAEDEYKIASEQDAGDKRLQEWAYYTSILEIYKGKPKTGISLAKDMIRVAGTTPGYGWYNIALSRALLYDGQIEESQKYADRAADFKEVHIGTTLGQSHYEFSIQLLKLINRHREVEQLKFEHRNWWYNPKVMLQLAGKMLENFMQQFLIINQFSQNPERDRVIYKLFSNESTVSWDEVRYLVRDFSAKFFINKFTNEAITDKREPIKKYFNLMVATLKMKQGRYKEAKVILDALSERTRFDPEYERLYLGRLYEAQAICARELGNKADCAAWTGKLFNTYPQLLPFSGLQMTMNLVVSGKTNNEAISALRGTSIVFNQTPVPSVPTAYVSFKDGRSSKSIEYQVLGSDGQEVVPKQSFSWQKPEAAGTELAYRLFSISGKDASNKQ